MKDINYDLKSNEFAFGEDLNEELRAIDENFKELEQTIDDLEIPGGLPYKEYAAYLNQVNELAPQVTVLSNTIGNIVWTRSGAGTYVATLTGAFTNKTVPVSDIWTDRYGNIYLLEKDSADTMILKTFEVGSNIITDPPKDNMLAERFICIRVYN